MALTDIAERLLADLLRDIEKSCTSLLDRVRSPAEIQQWVNDNALSLSAAVKDAAALCDGTVLSDFGNRLRRAYFVYRPNDDHRVLLKYEELLEAVRRLLRSIDATDAARKVQQPLDGNGKGIATTTKGSKPRGKQAAGSSGVEMKITAALLAHHQYEAGVDGSCMNFEPMSVRRLAQVAGVSEGSVSNFFANNFRKKANYDVACCSDLLAKSLMMLNGDLKPSILFNNLSGNANSLPDPASD